jgi:hypothetical protein
MVSTITKDRSAMMKAFHCLFRIYCCSICCAAFAFTARRPLWRNASSFSVFAGTQSESKSIGATGKYLNTLTMRDLSASYWFKVGQKVRVVDDVYKAGANLRDRQGTVVETFEKCQVDPTCCCAEQVDVGMAVRVEFPGSESDERESGSFVHYFAEDELLEVKEAQPQQSPQVAFDGQSCVAFKLDHLKMGQQAQRLAAFEASRKEDSSNNNDL